MLGIVFIYNIRNYLALFYCILFQQNLNSFALLLSIFEFKIANILNGMKQAAINRIYFLIDWAI